MKYVCLVRRDEAKLDRLDEAELRSVVERGLALIGELERSGRHVVSMGLQSGAAGATVKFRGGELTVTDGPFVETNEVLGGFTVVEAADLTEAVRLASHLAVEGLVTVEVRPLFDPDLPLTDPLDRKIRAAVLSAT